MRSNYYESQAAKLDHYTDMAIKKKEESESLLDRAHKMADVIPFGQPILVGHHSEKRDRNYRERIRNTYDKSFEAHEKAQFYERQCDRILNGKSAISSDAPDALDQLKEKLSKLEEKQTRMKAVNKIIKSKKQTKEQKTAELEKLGYSEQAANTLFEPDELGRVGYADYETTNNNANIRRIKQRIEALEREKSEVTTTQYIGDIEITNSVEENRIMITFPGIPSEHIRNMLKSCGFRWSPSAGAWLAYRTAAYKIPWVVQALTAMPAYVNPSVFCEVL